MGTSIPPMSLTTLLIVDFVDQMRLLLRCWRLDDLILGKVDDYVK